MAREVVMEVNKVKKNYIQKEGKFLNKKTTTNQVIDDISFDVYKNEFLVIFGPGQSGKTSLIKMMAGLERATEGSIMFEGKEITKPNPRLGYVFQSIALFPWRTVYDNVAFGPEADRENEKFKDEKVRSFIDLVGLGGFEDQFPAQLSGGMQQRVGIARAYANDPMMLLMDEPFGALDAQTRYLMQDELQRIWEKEKRTIVFITNNIEETIYLADRILLMSNTPATIKAEYEVNMEHPRDYTDPEFLKLRQEITDNMDTTF